MKNNFEQRKVLFQSTCYKYKKKSRNVSIARILIFSVLAIITVFLADKGQVVLLAFCGAISFLLFGIVVKYHQKIKQKVALHENLAKLNEEEIIRLNLDLGHFDTGENYLDETHPYAFDLDIFGRHSIYQLISRCTTKFGCDQLSSDLKKHIPKGEIIERQKAIRELSELLDWRQKLQATGRIHIPKEKSDLQQFYEWLANVSKIKNLPQLSFLAVIVWIFFAIACYYVFTGQWSFYWLFAFNIVALIFLGPKLKTIQNITLALSTAKQQLNAVSALIYEMESVTFHSSYLNELQDGFKSHEYTASKAIKELNGIVDLLDNRGNNIYLIANSFLMFDFFLLNKAEKWKEIYGHHIHDWFSIVGKFETALSYAAFSYAHPQYIFPMIKNDPFELSGKNIGHPLIDSEKRVCNDFVLKGKGSISLITGSNMAGKSTFLRSLGVNIALAQVGAPVCAEEFAISECRIFTSMRTKDNLQESVSTFYAELLRIKDLIKSIDENRPIFYLLDEILKGTNSHDRQVGAQALMHQLNNSNAFGLVSTHDVELHELTRQMKNFNNYSFHSMMKEGKIEFDYKLREGPCLNFNALELMKQMGISIP